MWQNALPFSPHALALPHIIQSHFFSSCPVHSTLFFERQSLPGLHMLHNEVRRWFAFLVRRLEDSTYHWQSLGQVLRPHGEADSCSGLVDWPKITVARVDVCMGRSKIGRTIWQPILFRANLGRASWSCFCCVFDALATTAVASSQNAKCGRECFWPQEGNESLWRRATWVTTWPTPGPPSLFSQDGRMGTLAPQINENFLLQASSLWFPDCQSLKSRIATVFDPCAVKNEMRILITTYTSSCLWLLIGKWPQIGPEFVSASMTPSPGVMSFCFIFIRNQLSTSTIFHRVEALVDRSVEQMCDESQVFVTNNLWSRKGGFLLDTGHCLLLPCSCEWACVCNGKEMQNKEWKTFFGSLLCNLYTRPLLWHQKDQNTCHMWAHCHCTNARWPHGRG